MFKEKSENDAYFIFSKLKEKLKSTLYYENLKAIYDKPKDDFHKFSVINLFFNIEDNFEDFEKNLDKPCIVFAVRKFLLDANYFFNFSKTQKNADTYYKRIEKHKHYDQKIHHVIDLSNLDSQLDDSLKKLLFFGNFKKKKSKA